MATCIKEIFKKLDRLKQVLTRKKSEAAEEVVLEELDLCSMQKSLSAVKLAVDCLKQLSIVDTSRSVQRIPSDVHGLPFRRKHPGLQSQLRKMQSLNVKRWTPIGYSLYQGRHCPTEESQDAHLDRKASEFSHYSRHHTLQTDRRRATETGVAPYRSHRSRLEYQDADPLDFLHCKSNSKIVIEDQNLRSARFPEFAYLSPRANASSSRSPGGLALGYRSVRTHRTDDFMPLPTKSRTPEGRRDKPAQSSVQKTDQFRSSSLIARSRLVLSKPERKQPSFVVAANEPIRLNRRDELFSPGHPSAVNTQPTGLRKVLSNFRSPKTTVVSRGVEKLLQLQAGKRRHLEMNSPLVRKSKQVSSNSQVRFEPKTEIIHTPPTVPNHRIKMNPKPHHSMDSRTLHLIKKSRSSHLGASPLNFTPSIEDARESVDLHLKEMSISDNNRSSHQTVKHGKRD